MAINAPYPVAKRAAVTAKLPNSGVDTALASQFGWTDQGNGVFRKGAMTMTAGELKPQLQRWSAIQNASNPASYNAGVDYQAAVSPYLSNATNQLSAATSLIGSGPAAVTMNNEYETRLRQLLENPDSVANTGAYKFAFNQGQQAIERSAAAKGMTGSGNVLAELSKYGQGMASQQYDKEADRLAGLTGTQNNYLLGLRSAATNDYNARVNAANSGTNSLASLGNLALNAAKAKSEDYWNANQLASNNLLSSGYGKQSVW